MNTWDTLFWQCEDLAALQAHLLSADEPWVRAQLLQQFAALKTYRNAEEWNRLVRACEGLRMGAGARPSLWRRLRSNG